MGVGVGVHLTKQHVLYNRTNTNAAHSFEFFDETEQEQEGSFTTTVTHTKVSTVQVPVITTALVTRSLTCVLLVLYTLCVHIPLSTLFTRSSFRQH